MAGVNHELSTVDLGGTSHNDGRDDDKVQAKNTAGKVIELASLSSEVVWQDGANCLGVDPDLFFPERGASTREAKEVCRGCTVRSDCLEYALVNGEKFGIWGGRSERERRRLRRQRAQASRTANPSS